MGAGAIDPIMEVLRSGSVTAQENAAEILFFLSLVEENKIIIGNSGAIRALVQLGDCRTDQKIDLPYHVIASLCIFQPGNIARAVEAGLSSRFRDSMEDPAGVVEEFAIYTLGDESTPQTREETEVVVAVLLAICSHDPVYMKRVKESNVIEALTALTHSRNFSDLGKRYASALLELLKKPEVAVLSQRVEGLLM